MDLLSPFAEHEISSPLPEGHLSLRRPEIHQPRIHPAPLSADMERGIQIAVATALLAEAIDRKRGCQDRLEALLKVGKP